MGDRGMENRARGYSTRVRREGRGWKKSTQTLSEDVTMKCNTVCMLVKK